MRGTAIIWGIVIFAFTACDSLRSPAQPNVRYSREVIDARMSCWYNKNTQVGFPNANSTNGIVYPENEASWDYVPGVVAKGILDVWGYYQDSAWADAWYLGLAEWVNQWNVENLEFKGGVLDDLNCAKVFIGLYNGAKPGGKFENAEKAAFYREQMHRCALALEEHKAKYSIASGGAEGGWMHKATDDPTQSYWGQMWCDGAYMGPALLAQLLVAGACEGTNLGWNDVYTQFTASWPYLWDAKKRLPYHVLFTDINTNKNARALFEGGHLYPCAYDSTIYHSEEFWGRAAGWYMMALEDVLEAYLANGKWKMENGKLPEGVGANFDILHEYLTLLADGLVARQDATTGCWYQLLQHGAEECASGAGSDASLTGSTTTSNGDSQCNYLESSASCLITAALLKGTRLGLIDHAAAGKRGFEGIVRTFVQSPITNDHSPITITSSCQSAGLSHDRNGSAAYYLIGKDVTIQDNTEGKVLGAFLMAAVEYERMNGE